MKFREGQFVCFQPEAVKSTDKYNEWTFAVPGTDHSFQYIWFSVDRPPPLLRAKVMSVHKNTLHVKVVGCDRFRVSGGESAHVEAALKKTAAMPDNARIIVEEMKRWVQRAPQNTARIEIDVTSGRTYVSLRFVSGENSLVRCWSKEVLDRSTPPVLESVLKSVKYELRRTLLRSSSHTLHRLRAKMEQQHRENMDVLLELQRQAAKEEE